MKPVNFEDQICSRTFREVSVRPITESGMIKLAEWFKNQNWADIIDASCVNKKAELLQNGVLIKVNEYLPIKTRKIAIDDKPWFTDELKKLRRKICREYKKHRKSNKYNELNRK